MYGKFRLTKDKQKTIIICDNHLLYKRNNFLEKPYPIIHTMDYYWVLKEKEILSNATASEPRGKRNTKNCYKSIKSYYTPITMNQGEAFPVNFQYVSHKT